MDMGMDTGSNTSTMVAMMKPYIHFTPGDFLFFSTWRPTTPGAMLGACLALFMVAFVERFVAALGRVLESQWAGNRIVKASRLKSCASYTSQSPLKDGIDSSSASISDVSQYETSSNSSKPDPISQRRIAAPFILGIQLQRGLRGMGAAVLGYILMLAVMSFNAGFILSIVIGLGVGEVMFGRFGISGDAA